MGILQKIVRNDATKSDPPEIYNARVILISLVACGGALLFGMDMGIIGGVLTMDSFKKQYGLMDQPKTVLANLESNIVSVIQAGAFAGALFSTWLANRVGRRFSLIISSILVFIGVALQAAASGHIEAMYVGRFIAGIAIGIASSVNPLYVSENAPRGIRGLLTGLYQLSIVTGLTLAFWINYGSLLHIRGHSQYIIPLSLQAFPAVILFVGMLLANESPRFLAQRSPEKAHDVLAKLRGLPADHPYVLQEMDGISRQLEEERALSVNASHLTLLKEAFSVRSYRRRAMLCITLMMWSNLTGTNAMTYYSPRIFASVGLSGSSAGLFATGVYGIVKMVSCAIFIVFVTDTLGRRKSLLWTGIVQGLALFYVGFYIRFDPPITGEAVSAPGYVALVAIYIFAAVSKFGWGPVVWTYSSEIPPARLRALMMGMATASQWLFNFVVAKATPSMFATLGANGFGTYFVYGTFCFVMVVFAWFFVPETSGKWSFVSYSRDGPCCWLLTHCAGIALEQMDELFEKDSLKDRLTFRKGPQLSARDGQGDDGVLDKKKEAEHVEDA
ncbi:MFS quinate transporter [Colletotrichum musicola]|uniref:MFS quinate transporter n=1 Tax=Colletotrichum musicola TaxID=2175873 RepID=A0A8H6KKK1_9PEZI|nr:MFS quinate transporter [Colletotrichum musicola]